MERLSTLTLMERIPDEDSAYEYLEALRWKGTPVCPYCGQDERIYFLNPVNGPRVTSTGATTALRRWKCGACRRKFSVLTGTVMHNTKLPVRTWLLVMFEMASNKNGVAAREIERRYNLTPRSAWHLLHRIREAMRPDAIETLGGNGHVVVADETFMGGSFKNRHQSKQPKYTSGRGGGPYDKTPVLSLIDVETGEVRSRVLERVDGSTLRKAIAEQVDMPNTILHTDKASSYKGLSAEMAAHHTVDHKAGEYARREPHGVVTTNHAEGFFSQLKRSLDGTHHHVTTKHLARYLGEFDYRYTTCKRTDTERMMRLVDQTAGRRLSYARLIA